MQEHLCKTAVQIKCSLKELRETGTFRMKSYFQELSTPFFGLPRNGYHVKSAKHLPDRCSNTNSPQDHLPKDPLGNCTPVTASKETQVCIDCIHRALEEA